MPSENDDLADGFDGLRRLLALKRREFPPVGFFNNFAARVISRIEAEELAREEKPWWRQTLGLSTARILAGANLLTVCGLAFVGVSLYLVVSGEIEPAMIAGSSGTSLDIPAAAGFGIPSSGLAGPAAVDDLSPIVGFSASLMPLGRNFSRESSEAAVSISPEAVDAESEREAARALFKPGAIWALNAEPVAVPTYRMVVPR
ncbi:MAG: hypothetical protein EXS36_16540 [Pedosphaera sp.]|nr:hypothetical protein [Pedosphaera sp.]